MVTTPEIDPNLLSTIIGQLPESWTPADDCKQLVADEVHRLSELVQASTIRGIFDNTSATPGHVLLLCIYSRGLLAGYNYAKSEACS